MDDQVRWVTKAEAAEELEVSLSTLDRKIRSGEIEVRREGRRVYVRMHGPDYLSDGELLHRSIAREDALERTVRELERKLSASQHRASELERERDEARESAATAGRPYVKLQIDHRQEIVYTPPGNIVIELRVAGAAPGGNRTVGMRVLNALTPETAKTTHYFWSLVRDVELDDEEITRWAFQANKDTFDEDVAVIEPQQRMIDTAPEPARSIRWSVDKGVTQAHRWIERLLDEEAGPAAGDS